MKRVLLALSLAVLPSLRAAEPVPFDDLVRLALSNNAALPALRAAIDEAQAQRRTAGDVKDPELRGSYSDRDDDVAADGPAIKSKSVGLRVFPPDPRIRSARSAAGAARTGVAAARLRGAEEQTRASLLSSIVAWRRALEDVRFADREVAAVGDYVKRIGELLSAGTLRAGDSVSAAARRMTAENDRAASHRALRTAARVLSEQIGVPVPDDFAISGLPDFAGFVPRDGAQRGALQGLALSNRAALAEFASETAVREAGRREVRAGQRLWIDNVQVSYIEHDEGTVESQSGWGVQAAVRIPLFSWSNGELPAAAASVAAAKAREQEAREEVTRHVADAWETVRATREALDAATKQAEASVAEVRGLLDAAVRDNLPPDAVLRLEEARIGAERAKAAAAADYEAAVAELMTAVGTTNLR